jgi:hypothetical protein
MNMSDFKAKRPTLPRQRAFLKGGKLAIDSDVEARILVEDSRGYAATYCLLQETAWQSERRNQHECASWLSALLFEFVKMEALSSSETSVNHIPALCV